MRLMDCREFAERGRIGAARMQAVDANAIALGLSSLQMMETAGAALARAALEEAPARVLVFAGAGNNGGDGLVAARHLAGEVEVEVVSVAGRATPANADQAALLARAGVPVRVVGCAAEAAALGPELGNADLVIDALLGIGAVPPLREPVATLVGLVNISSARVIAADVPTPGCRADRVLAFHRPKTDGAETVPIGIPLEAEICAGPGDLLALARRRRDAHKGDGGRVLVVGGGPYQGAPYLAGLAALRAGADVVLVATPAPLPYPDVITIPVEGGPGWESHLDRLAAEAERADAVVMGNGLGPGSAGIAARLAPSCRRAVVDADALRPPLPVAPETVYTPHAGEFARVFGPLPAEGLADRARAVRRAARDGVVLLKGPVDIVSDGERVRFNRTGTPAMTVGGTGDVLAGVVGALLCRLSPFEAAVAGAYATGVAGEQAARGRTAGLLASDMLTRLPGALYGGSQDA
ncbi:MAG TPA: NAD(P)H-hydrate dehydratase [Methanoregulaceae archaeon]|nr:NAD(P)H-hydrate dehydratase [Methanoregulaceae archaeon]HQJ87692.1 NAD(P)H-hydrate dehydratase [Methanoregulaceae archaeon]